MHCAKSWSEMRVGLLTSRLPGMVLAEIIFKIFFVVGCIARFVFTQLKDRALLESK